MDEFILDSHAESCKCHSSKIKSDAWDYFCELNPERLLFYLNNKYILITYFRCLEMGDHLGLKMEIIKKVVENHKVYELYKVQKAVSITDELAKFRKTASLKNKITQEVNYIYYDSFGKKYAITTQIRLRDKIFSLEEIEKSFIEAKEYIRKKGYENLLNQLIKLHESNYEYIPETEMAKSIPHLVKLINKKTKQNATS